MDVFMNVFFVSIFCCIFVLIRCGVAVSVVNDFSKWAHDGINNSSTVEEMKHYTEVYCSWDVGRFIFVDIGKWSIKDVLESLGESYGCDP